ncbi:MAG: hypothetical protein JOZ99_01695 [Actinobacteria bacterium]|nr:hypothetical protein [Actinomycetota bacterium]
MSVIVVGRMSVDPKNVEKLWNERRADFEAVAREARAAGATHHRWGFGDDHVVIIDEWPTAEAFDRFFSSQAKIADLMATAGVAGPPEFTIVEARRGPDEF